MIKLYSIEKRLVQPVQAICDNGRDTYLKVADWEQRPLHGNQVRDYARTTLKDNKYSRVNVYQAGSGIYSTP